MPPAGDGARPVGDVLPAARPLPADAEGPEGELVVERSTIRAKLSPEALVEMGVSSKADEGRGGGLYLINQSIVRYNGQIELFNNDDFGARVTVYLPKEEMQ